MKRQQQVIQLAFVVADALAVAGAWLLAFVSRFRWEVIPVYRGIPPFGLYAMVLVVVVPAWLLFFKFGELYSLKRGESHIDEFIAVFKAGSLATMFLISLTFFYRDYSFSRAVIVLFWLYGMVLVSVMRAQLLRLLEALRGRGMNIKRVLVVGCGALAEVVAEKMERFPGFGLRLEGFVDPGNGGERCTSVMPRIKGTFDDLLRLVGELKVDQIIIALPRDAHKSFDRLLSILEKTTVDIKVVPDLLQFMALKTGLEEIDGIPIINLSETPLSGWYGPVKRTADIIFALVALILAAPLMLVIALLVKLTSRGPALFRQERMGLDGTIFIMYKFRSMRVDAEKETGAVWATANDPRRTRLGAFLRRTSLDELPQLFNVLKGEMSFVGPRPERPHFVAQFRDRIPRYMLRHKVKCGLTGWAQVNGYRGNTSIEKRIEYDMFYIENWSPSFDVKIIWLTFWKGLINKHAY